MLHNFDLAQAENRIVAYLANESAMINAFETGKDVHRLTASGIFGKPPEMISDEPCSAKTIGDGSYSERFFGKKANHSLNYNTTDREIAYQLEIPIKQATHIVESYHKLYPGIRSRYHASILRQLESDRTIANCFGRRYTFVGRWGKDLFNQAFSFIPQSTVADKINTQGLLFIYNDQDFFHFFEIINQVHDSIKLQTPCSDRDFGEEWAPYVANRLLAIKSSLEIPLYWQGREFIIPADLSIGFNEGKFHKHSKKCKENCEIQENLGGLRSVKFEPGSREERTSRLAEQLLRVHSEFRATLNLS